MRLFNTPALNSRIAVVVAVLVFLAVGLVTAASILLAKREMRDLLGDEQYSTLRAAGAYIDRDIDARRTVLRALAEQVPDSAGDSRGAIQRFLESHTTLREEFSNVVAFDPEGNIVASLARLAPGALLSVKEREFFRDTLNFHEGVVSAPFRSRLSGRSVVLITQPILDSRGRLMFILGGSLDLNSPRIFNQLEAFKPGKTGYIALIAGDGTIILHPDKERILSNVHTEKGGPTPATAAALAGFEGWTHGSNKRGVESLMTYRRLRTNDWIISSVYPVSEALAPFGRARDRALMTAVVVAVLAGLIGWLGIGKLLRPLGALQRHVAKLAVDGDNVEVFNVARKDEFGKLSRAFYALSKQRQQAEAALAAQAMTDPLTGLHNRRMFDAAVLQAFARGERSGSLLALAYLDIDRFKSINDSLGHGNGDLVLVEFARRLKHAVRAMDTVVRIAGDEFVVIFEGLGSTDEAAMLGQKIIDAMRAPMRVGALDLPVSTSIGICAGAVAHASVHDFVTRADAALYRAKQQGRGRYVVDVLARPVDIAA